MITRRQIIRHYELNEADALGLLRAWRDLDDEVGVLLATARAERHTSLATLAAAYLPRLDPNAFTRAQALTGYQGFARRDPLKAMAREKHVLRSTVAQIEADPRFTRRLLLVGPGGERTLALQEAREMLEPWEAACAPFEACEGWDELIATCYDTPHYSVPFFEKKYWTLWRLGDRACETLRMADFGDDVLPAFGAADAQRQIWRRQVAEAEAAVAEIHSLVQTRDQAEARIPRLPELYLQACQGQLAEYLATADLALLEQWLKDDAEAPDRGILMALRTAAGAAAKVRLLDELRSEGIARSIGQLLTRRQKFAAKSAKYGRAKYAKRSFSTYTSTTRSGASSARSASGRSRWGASPGASQRTTPTTGSIWPRTPRSCGSWR
jgi:hypothetical protein